MIFIFIEDSEKIMVVKYLKVRCYMFILTFLEDSLRMTDEQSSNLNCLEIFMLEIYILQLFKDLRLLCDFVKRFSLFYLQWILEKCLKISPINIYKFSIAF